jgi:hypothetical protein
MKCRAVSLRPLDYMFTRTAVRSQYQIKSTNKLWRRNVLAMQEVHIFVHVIWRVSKRANLIQASKFLFIRLLTLLLETASLIHHPPTGLPLTHWWPVYLKATVLTICPAIWTLSQNVWCVCTESVTAGLHRWKANGRGKTTDTTVDIHVFKVYRPKLRGT